MTPSATLINVVASEWTKLRSVRSTMWTVAATFLVTVGLSALVSLAMANASPQNRPVDSIAVALAGVTMGQLAIVVLGVMVVASEYSSGGIRTTFVAVPRRLRVLAAKAIVLSGVGVAVGIATTLASFLLGQALLSHGGVDTAALGDPGVARAVFGGGLYLGATAIFGFAFATLLRSTAGAITFSVGALLVLPIAANFLPGSLGDTVSRYLPGNAGHQVMAVGYQRPGSLGPLAGFAVFCLWSAAIFAIGAVLVQRGDA